MSRAWDLAKVVISRDFDLFSLFLIGKVDQPHDWGELPFDHFSYASQNALALQNHFCSLLL